MSSRYESLVLDAIPAGCRRAADIGCGNGELTRDLRRRGIPEVVGLDRDEPCVQRCRLHPDAGDIRYVVGDLRSTDLAPQGFDLVSAVASLHHLDAREGLLRLRSLVAPGGVLVVVGLARPDLPRDLPIEVAAQIAGRFRRRTADPAGDPLAPIVWPPPERYSTMRHLARELLPGVRWRRHLSWRYSLVWARSSRSRRR
ncbi:class I SAM-dependent methyltransferase [Paractinoplanes globisporus]|uniref:Class I SAM-dependent methyltransferase n=1 Tax=Paractinoplanes globisporus TaxID=113565 RepID=A0ABW6WA99_9ACTN|nr:class I SAM-dependent methyltransferase [Actinoplanes globisporus]